MFKFLLLLIFLIAETVDQIHDEYLVGDDQYYIEQSKILLLLFQAIDEGDKK
jgi:hypothetical protein